MVIDCTSFIVNILIELSYVAVPSQKKLMICVGVPILFFLMNQNVLQYLQVTKIELSQSIEEMSISSLLVLKLSIILHAMVSN